MKPMARNRLFAFFFLVLFSLFPASVCRAEQQIMTKFTVIRYADDQDLAKFCWRITGQRVLTGGEGLVRSRVDELVRRVEEILEMYPGNFRFTILLVNGNAEMPVAQYSHGTRTVSVAVDRATDGVLAHEIAHAVICVYFPVPPPERAQEILAQYVDKHLYEDPLSIMLK